jgi:hypothetical protein
MKKWSTKPQTAAVKVEPQTIIPGQFKVVNDTTGTGDSAIKKVVDTKTGATRTVCWTAKTLKVKNCDFHTKKSTLYLANDVHEAICAITDQIKNTEWLGYLHGHKDQDGDFIIEKLTIPEQEVTGGSVDVLVPEDDKDIIGTVHLHPWPNAGGFSGTDDEYISSNHEISILTDTGYHYHGQTKVTLPCGGKMLMEATVVVERPYYPDLDEILASVAKNVKKPAPATVVIETKPSVPGMSSAWAPANKEDALNVQVVKAVLDKKFVTAGQPANAAYWQKVHDLKEKLDVPHGNLPDVWKTCECCRCAVPDHRMMPGEHGTKLCPECYVQIQEIMAEVKPELTAKEALGMPNEWWQEGYYP